MKAAVVILAILLVACLLGQLVALEAQCGSACYVG